MTDCIRFVGDLVVPGPTDFRIPEEYSGSLVFNLEGPLTRSNASVGGKICLRQEPDSFSAVFEKCKPLAACLANNHIMDYGARGFQDTKQELERLTIPYYGAGTLTERANNPLVLSLGGTLVAFMGYVCPSTNPIFALDDQPGVVPPELERIRIDMADARAKGADLVVVSVHWGAEEVEYPKPCDIRLAREIASLGADIIIGHHAHCRQPWTKFGETKVYFGLGNAYFPNFSVQVASGVEAWGKQRGWNRTSYLVEVTPSTRESRVSQLRQEDMVWSATADIEIEQIGFTGGAVSDRSHDIRFQRAYRKGMVRLAVSRFLARPRLPRLSSLIYLLRALKSGT